MAATRKRPAPDLPARLAAFFGRHVAPGARLAAAFSGGADSAVLLHLLAGLRKDFPFQLSALHVNHQLSPNADAWAAFCRAECVKLGVPLTVRRVTVERDGRGVEAAARDARYAAFADVRTDAVVLAQHRDDQAETVLLQLLRGAGAAGLAAMPEKRETDGLVLLRPLLDVPKQALLDYAAKHGIPFITDESNADTAYDRNYLRHSVMPEIVGRWPDAAAAIARSARHLGESLDLMREMAAMDAAACTIRGGVDLVAWRRLSPPRARNVLRHLLLARGIVLAAHRFDTLCAQLTVEDAPPAILEMTDEWRVVRYRGRMEIIPPQAATSPYVLEWDGAAPLALPNGMVLELSPAVGQGIRASALAGKTVQVRSRVGGETLRMAPACPRRPLKKLYQDAGIPAWRRQQPVLWLDGAVIAVPDLGVDADFAAAVDEPGLLPVLSLPISHAI